MAGQILVADDSRDTVELLEVSLNASGWQVFRAATVAEAKTRIDTEHFDLIVLGNRLLEGDRADLCRELRSSKPHLPILLLSEAAYLEDISGARNASNIYLIKPCDLNQLIRAVHLFVGWFEARPVAEPAA